MSTADELSKTTREELIAKIVQLEEELQKTRKTAEWYAEKVVALSRVDPKKVHEFANYCHAIITEMSLDGGRRARECGLFKERCKHDFAGVDGGPCRHCGKTFHELLDEQRG